MPAGHFRLGFFLDLLPVVPPLGVLVSADLKRDAFAGFTNRDEPLAVEVREPRRRADLGQRIPDLSVDDRPARYRVDFSALERTRQDGFVVVSVVKVHHLECHSLFPLSSGAIHSAKLASHAEKRSNLIAVEIRIHVLHCDSRALIDTRKVRSITFSL